MTSAAPSCSPHHCVSPVPSAPASRPAHRSAARRWRSLASLLLHAVAVLAAAALLLLVDNPVDGVTFGVGGTPHPVTVPATAPAPDATEVAEVAGDTRADGAVPYRIKPVVAQSDDLARIGARVTAARAQLSTVTEPVVVRSAPLHRAAR